MLCSFFFILLDLLLFFGTRVDNKETIRKLKRASFLVRVRKQCRSAPWIDFYSGIIHMINKKTGSRTLKGKLDSETNESTNLNGIVVWPTNKIGIVSLKIRELQNLV